MSYNPLSISSRANVSFEGARPSDYIWVSPSGSNSNSGSEGSPLKSIQAALNRAGPDTAVMVKEGRYNESIKISKSGTADKPIWLVSADGMGAAEIRSKGGPVISSYSGEDNFVIKGFELVGGSDGLKLMGSLSDPTSNVVLQENIIHGQSVDGIKTSKSEKYAIIGNKVYDVNGQEGIDNVYIRNSIIADNDVRNIDGLTGITAKAGAENIKILDNFIKDVRDGISVGGNSTNQGVAWPSSHDFEARNFHVEGNEIHDASRAIRVAGAENSTIANNLFNTNNGRKPDVWVGRDNNGWESKNIKLWGNRTDGGDWLDVEGGSSASTSGGGDARPSEQARLMTASEEVSAKAINGTRGSETLKGTSKADVIKGHGGNDKLVASRGADDLHGGAGKDKFDYNYVSASTPKAQDEIMDFSYGKDVIDLSSIDASTRSGGNQRFKFVGDDEFDDRAGELRFEKEGGDWLVQGDVNGDGVADLQILVNAKPNAEMFIL